MLLTTRCQTCAKELDGANPAIDVCGCGAMVTPGLASTFESAVDGLLAGIISGADDAKRFSQAGLHQVSAHLTRLGAVSSGWSAERPQGDVVASLAMREEGLRLHDSPTALRSALDAIVAEAAPGSSGRPGITSAYGWVWRSWLGVPSDNPLDTRLRLELLKHATVHGIRSQRGARDVTLAQAGAMLGSGHDRTRRLVRRAGLITGVELPGVAMSIDADGVGRLTSTLAGLLDAKSTAAALGIGRVSLRALTSADLVVPDASALTIGAGALWSRATLEAFVDAVSAGAPRLNRAPSGCAPLPSACRDASVSLTVAVRALLEGRVAPVARTKGGLDGIWVTVDEVRRLAPSKTGTIREAARELAIHYEAARWLTAEGHLGISPGMIDRAVVTAFGAAFVTAAQVGRVLNVSPRTAASRMRSAGFRPVFGPPSCRQEIWSRDALRSMSTF